jgi:hypothetical protein
MIKSSASNPNKNNQILVSKDCFKSITDTKFKSFVSSIDTYGNFIDLNSLIKYLSTEANTTSTRGKYHEMIDMIIALYQLPISNDLPDFDNLDKKTYEQIFPKRVEYLICWWIMFKISNDKFLSKYKFSNGKNLTMPLFQKLISNNDDRFYDVVFECMNLIIEIQENNSAHNLNPNDLLKEALVKLRSKRIIYFKMAEFESDNYEYLKNFWSNDLRPALVESLLNYSGDIRQDYCINVFKNSVFKEYISHRQSITKLKEKFESEYYTEEQKNKINLQILATIKMMQFLEPMCISNANDQSLISQLFGWIDKSTEQNKFNIDIEEAFNIILIRITNFKSIDDIELFLIDNFYPYKRIQTKIFIDWKTMVEMALNNVEADMKKRRQISKYLLSIQDIYEDIIP